MRSFRPLLAEHDLTEQQWRVLRALTAASPHGDGSNAPDGPEASALAASTSLLAPSLSRILSHLERRQLIERHTMAHDQRRSTIALTARGRALVAEVAPRSEAIYNQIEEAFGAERLGRLLDELKDLAELDPLAPSPPVRTETP